VQRDISRLLDDFLRPESRTPINIDHGRRKRIEQQSLRVLGRTLFHGASEVKRIGQIRAIEPVSPVASDFRYSSPASSTPLSDARTVTVLTSSIPLSDARTVTVLTSSIPLSDARIVNVRTSSIPRSDARTVTADYARTSSIPRSNARTDTTECARTPSIPLVDAEYTRTPSILLSSDARYAIAEYVRTSSTIPL
jgi:hypothetical protein